MRTDAGSHFGNSARPVIQLGTLSLNVMCSSVRPCTHNDTNINISNTQWHSMSHMSGRALVA
jgi:hypothetical protein